MSSTKQKLFTLTKKDFRFDYFRGSGKGGQKRNKTASKVRCTHDASGAVGQSDDTRSQHKNKAIAFQRMAATKKFKDWVKLKAARQTGKLKAAEDYANYEMETNIKIEVKENGKWIPE